MRPCAKPVPKPRTKTRLQTRTQPVAEDIPESPEPDFVVVDKVFPPQQTPYLLHVADRICLTVTASTNESDIEGPEEGYADMRTCDTGTECVNSGVLPDVSDSDLHITRNRDEPTLTDIDGGAGSEAYSHSNPFHLPKSACNAVSVRTDMVSQVLTSFGTALFEKALQGAFESVQVL